MLEYTKEDLKKITYFMGAEKEMLRYVRYSIIQMTLLIPFCLVMSALFIRGVLQEVTRGTSVFMFLLMLFLGLLLGFGAFFPFLDYREMIAFLKRRVIYNEAIVDFSYAQSFLNDRIRLGNKYIFGKRCCTILKYTDICRVYQYVRKVNFIERNRELHAVDASGKVWTLCKLKTHIEARPQLHEELLKVLRFMLYKNNRIAIGYWS